MELKIRKILLLLFLAVTFIGRGDELSTLLESVERRNLGLKAIREEMKADGFEIKEQNMPDNTSVEYSPFFRRGAEGIASSELIVTQEFDFPSLYVARNKAGKGKLATAERRYLVDARDVLTEAAENYILLVKLKKINRLLNINLENAEKISTSIAKKASVGEATSVEANSARLQVITVRQLLLDNEGEIASVMSAIKALNGYESFDCNAESYPDWTFTEASGVSPESDAELLLAESEVKSVALEEKVARQSWVPKLTLGYRRNTELEEASHGFVVGASFPLFTGSARVKAAKARKAAAEVNMENARQKVASEIETMAGELTIISRSMSLYDQSLIDETERLLNKSVSLGNITVTDYYNELRVLNERKMEYIDVEYEYYMKLCVLYKNKLFQNIK